MKNVILDNAGKIRRLIYVGSLSKTDIARAVGVSFNTVYRWLNKGIKPHPQQAKRIDELFRKHVDMVPVIL